MEKQLSSYKRIDLHWENKQVFLYFSVELCSTDDGDCLVPLAQCHTFCCLYKVIKKLFHVLENPQTNTTCAHTQGHISQQELMLKAP